MLLKHFSIPVMLETDAIIKMSHMYVVMYYLCIIYVSNIQTLHGQTYLTTYYVDNHKGLKLSHHVVEFGNVVFRFRFAEFQSRVLGGCRINIG